MLALLPVFCLTSNGSVKFCAAVLTGLLSAVWLYSLAGRTEEKGDLGLARNLLAYTAGSTLSHLDPSLKGLFSGSRRKKNLGKILIGVLCAVPVAAVTVALLAFADDAFSGMIGKISDAAFASAGKTALGVVLGLLIAAFALALKKTAPEPVKEPWQGRVGVYYTAAFSGVLCVCCLAYLFSQLAYFTDAFKGLLPEGYSFSYAEYARKGFFELCAIAPRVEGHGHVFMRVYAVYHRYGAG